MGATKWEVRYNKKSGEPYYVDNKGNISWKKPDGFEDPKNGETVLKEKTGNKKPEWKRGFGNQAGANNAAGTRAAIPSWKKPSTLSGVTNQNASNQSSRSSTPSWVKNRNTAGGNQLKEQTTNSRPATPSWSQRQNQNRNTAGGNQLKEQTINSRPATPSWSQRQNQGGSKQREKPVTPRSHGSNSSQSNIPKATGLGARKKSQTGNPQYQPKTISNFQASRREDRSSETLATGATSSGDNSITVQSNSKKTNGFKKRNREQDDEVSKRPNPPPKPVHLKVGYVAPTVTVDIKDDKDSSKHRSSRLSRMSDLVRGSFRSSDRNSFRGSSVDVSSSLHMSSDGPPPLPEKPAHIKNSHKFEDKQGDLVNNFKLALFAHNLGYIAGVLYVYMGLFNFLWNWRRDGGFINPPGVEETLVAPFWVGFYAIILGFATLWWEKYYSLHRTDRFVYSRRPIRGILYILLSLPCFASYATILAAAVAILCGIVNIMATMKGEIGVAKDGKYCPNVFKWEKDSGTIFVAIAFIIVNVGAFAWNYLLFEDVRYRCIRNFNEDIFDQSCPSIFAPLAKGFGNMINLNAAIITIPIMRAMLRSVAESINENNMFPFKKATEFHKIIGFVLFLSVFGHMTFHYANFAFASVTTVLTFGNTAWITGGMLTLIMSIMFSGAHYIVKRAHYELFWNTHHLYVAFFMLLLAHAPHFWQWFLVPIILFTMEKSRRSRTRGKRKIYVESAEFIPPVLNLNFSPERLRDFEFREGQYLYLQCNSVSPVEWHPFSMSSAYGDLEAFGYVSVHIRVQDPGSWTYKLKEHFRLIAGKANTGPNDPFICDNLHHYSRNGQKLVGLHSGPDGQPLIRVDGPFASPTQVYSAYRDVILVGSGIGLTPSASILRGILRHKWKKGFYPDSIRFCWILRQSEIDSFHWFIELLVDLSNRVQNDRLAGALTEHRYVEMNIYVTKASKTPSNLQNVKMNTRTLKRKENEKSDVGFDADAGFTANDLRRALLNPTVDASSQGDVPPNANAANRFGDIIVWNGRPKWDSVFAATQKAVIERRENDRFYEDESNVGVCFCGHPVIGKALKQECESFSKKDRTVTFQLNAEVF